MSRDRGPVLKRARALGIEPQYLGVNKKSKRHGAVRRRKKSEYGIQLTEKQKVRFTYGLSETQFRNLFEKASKRKDDAHYFERLSRNSMLSPGCTSYVSTPFLKMRIEREPISSMPLSLMRIRDITIAAPIPITMAAACIKNCFRLPV